MTVEKIPNIASQAVITCLQEVKPADTPFNKKINLFSHNAFDFLNTCSLAGMKPILFSATKFQEGLKMMDSTSKWTQIRGFFRICLSLVFSLPMAILSAPGITFRAICSLNRNQFGFSPATLKIPGDKNDKSLNVMTWNVGLGPEFMSVTNGLDPGKERVDAIVNQIVKQDPDIVSLQEVFDSTVSKDLVKKLNERGYDCIHSVLTQGTTQISSGLFLAVKRRKGMELSISEVKAWQFENSGGADKMSNKGLLGIKFNVKLDDVEKSMYIFNTHLQASYGEDGYSHVRKEQVKGIAAKIQDWTMNHPENVLLCGDLNFGATKIESGDDDNEYEEQMLTFNAVHLTDDNREEQLATLEGGSKGQGTFMNVNEKKRSTAIIDYILHGEGFKPSKPRVIEIETDHPCSDHYPVVETMSFVEPELVSVQQ